MSLSKYVGVALSALLLTAVAAPAFAGDHRDAGAFPMKADAFKQKVEQRLSEKKARMEKRITEKKVEGAKAGEMRQRFDERAAKVRAALNTAAQDGVITKEEAHDIRKAGRHHRHHPEK